MAQHEREEVDPIYSPPGLGYVIIAVLLSIVTIIPVCIVLASYLQR